MQIHGLINNLMKNLNNVTIQKMKSRPDPAFLSTIAYWLN